MTIRFYFRGLIYQLDIGYKTEWFSQSYFISFVRVVCNEGRDISKMIWHSKSK